MNKIILGIIVGVFSFVSHAKKCEIPINQIEVGSIRLTESVKEFKVKHPLATFSNDYTILINGELGTDEKFKKLGVEGNWFIKYDNLEKIIAYSLIYNDGSYADYDTPIENFKNKLMTSSKLPINEWRLIQNKTLYRYECEDYRIDIRQDYGLGRGSLGANVAVISRYSELF